MVTMPNIDIIFNQLATSLITRSQRGYAILIVRDITKTTFDYKEYNLLTDVSSSDFTATNYQYISDIFAFAPYKVCVVRIDTTVDTIADALTVLTGNVKTGWVTIADGATADFTALASWTKSQEGLKKYYKAVTYKATTTDCKHIVNFYNDSVIFNDARTTQTGEKYCPSLIGILASCNISRASTNFVCSNLTRVVEVADNNVAVGAGKFILINDVDIVKIGEGVNSLQTTNGTTLTEDMKYIDIVEAMDLIYDDIFTTFKTYQGSYKNKYENQVLLISAINGYFKSLTQAGVDVLDSEYNNAVNVDVETQRAAWIAIGKTEAATWTDAKVKLATFKRNVFLASNVKILGAMENLQLVINME
jgi:hypothetical protein